MTSTLKIASAAIGVGGITTGAGIGIYKFTRSSERKQEVSQNSKTKTVERKAISELLSETIKRKK